MSERAASSGIGASTSCDVNELSRIADTDRAALLAFVNECVDSREDEDEDEDENHRTSNTRTRLMAFMRTLERYRERAVLLDPLLEALISPLTKTVAEEVSSERTHSRRVLRCCEALDAISSLRGWKTCVRFYPNATKYLEPAVRMLRDARTFDGSRRVSWEVQRVTLAWLSLLALVPFDLLTIDSDTDATSKGANTIPRVVRVLMYECKLFLGDPGACRDVAAQTLAKLVTRPDMKSVLRDFMSWSSLALRGDVNVEGESMFLVPGILRTLAAIYKIGRRDALLEFAESSWQDVENTRETDLAKDSTLIRQLSMKLACRVGLAFLKPRVVSWRYDRGSRRLEDNIIRGSSNVKDEEILAIAIRDDDDGDDVHVAIDGIVEICLRGLRDSETFVRWGSAKALGRIASRLPQDFADEIVGAILECLSVIENDSTWHGACLALAELARRGLLLPNRLSEVVPLCVQALTYDVRRGAHSIGAHVRDAAAYVCWALSRAYAPDDFAPFVHGLAPTLLMVACFDREVNCRRAASAAFQEAVGRLGKFPHGIDIVNFADYFSLGSKTRAALDVAPFVCQFAEYRRPLMEHVLDVKLTHWECSTRRLAARAIGILGDLDPEWVAEVGVETVLARTRSLDLPSRHGSIIALGEMLLVTSRMNTRLDSDVNVRVLNVISESDNEVIFTGEGGLLIRSATCRLIECIARAVGSVSMDAYTRDALVAIAEACMESSSEDVQSAASGAICALADARFPADNAGDMRRLVMNHVALLGSDSHVALRRGSARLLGGLPVSVLMGKMEKGQSVHERASWRVIIDSLTKTVADSHVETRVCAVISLAELTCTVLNSGGVTSGADVAFVDEHVVDALLMCLSDYTTDNRGDVGSWLREAAMKALPLVIGAIQSRVVKVDAHRCRQVISGVLKQAFEKIDRVRCQALVTLTLLARGGEANRQETRIAHGVTVRALCQARGLAVLREVLPETVEGALDASHAANLFDTMLPLLRVEDYAYNVLSGWFLSAGSLGDSLARFSIDALLRAMSEYDGVPTLVVQSIVKTLRENKHNDRVTIPVLRVCDVLMSRGVVDGSSVPVELIDAVRAELYSSRDISKLLAGCACLSHFVRSANEGLHKSSTLGMLALLANRFPRVRSATAEHMYLALLSLHEPSRDDLDAMRLLSSNCWDAPTSATKDVRKRLYAAFGLELPPFMLKECSRAAKAKAVDGEGNYAALVHDVGF